MNRLKQILLSKRLRRWLAITVMALTVVIFWRFFAQHPEYLVALRNLNPWIIPGILGFNAAVLITLVFIANYTLELCCGKRLPLKEQFLLTAYASLANFLGPLQSGPGVRAVYLKAKHGVRIRDYMLASLVYYAMFALISTLFLFGGSRPWWQTMLALIAVAALCYTVIRWFMRKDKKTASLHFQAKAGVLGKLLLATFIQVLMVAGYYFIELKAVSPEVSLEQGVSYTGAANFALFLSITPDGIGIREALLALSTQLHQVSGAVILASNVIDRAVYALFLGLLFVLVLAVHAKDRFAVKVKSEAVE